MFGAGTTGGPVEVGYGELVLGNVDGALDALADYGFNGRAFALLVGDDAAAYSSFTTVLSGTMDQAVFTMAEVTVRLRDKLQLLDKRQAAPNRFGGTNALPAGVDGTADDIRGKPKPKIYGRVLNVSPPVVNTSRLIYQCNDGAIAAVNAVYDNGISLTAGAVYTSQTDMETNAPAASGYRVWPAGGMFRLGSSPAGQITADVSQGAGVANRTAGQILQALASGPGGLAGSEVSSADVTALDTAQPAELGLWIDGEQSVREAMTTVAAAVGAWFGFDRTGVLRMGRLSAPAVGTGYLVFRSLTLAQPAGLLSADILDIERVVAEDEGRGIPAYSVTVRHSKNWTVQTSGLAGAVTATRRAFLAEEYRTAVATDSTVLNMHPLAPTLERETLLLTQAAADAEAARLLAVFGVRRDRLKIRSQLGTELVSLADLGSTVRVSIDRFGYDAGKVGAGKLMLVTAIEYDAQNNVADLELWG
jgi:hypothetical protein